MSNKYQAYAEYKDSEIEWLGEIPKNWHLTKVAWNFKAEKGKNGQLLTKEYCGLNLGPYPVYSGQTESSGIMGHINSFEFDSGNEGVLFSTTVGAKAMHLSQLRGKFSLSQNCMIIIPKSINFYTRFSYYHFQPLFTYERGLIPEHMQASFRVEDLYQYIIALPPYDEQQKIANFLDHETAKIDTLIEKQQQLIKLLKEKRQAVISHAVTKGLNPNAPMRDSGVEWLGEVPEHWEIRRINLLFSESSIRASTEVELDYPVLSVSIHHGISDKELNSEELDRKVQRSEDKSLYKVVHENYLAYNMMRAWQGGFGASTLSGLVSPAYVVCQPRTLLNSFYFELVLRTQNAVIELKRYSRGITDFRLRLYWDEFRIICVPVPPSNEIGEILESISKINSTYDNLVVVAERQIKLLQERRTALISAAVTGKIDLRNWQVANKENKEAAL